MKRGGKRQFVNPEKIRIRLERLSRDLDKNYVKLEVIVEKVANYIIDGITTEELDKLSAETCAYMNIVHPDYSRLAARICASNLHKETYNSFFETIHALRNCKDKLGAPAPLIAEDVYEIVKNN